MIQHATVDIGEAGAREIRFPGIVPLIGPVSLPVRTAGPDLGQHTEEIRARYLEGRVQ